MIISIKLNKYIDRLNRIAGFGPIKGEWKTSLNIAKFDPATAAQTRQYLDSLEGHFIKLRKAAMDSRDSVENSIGKEKLMLLRKNYENSKLNDYMLNNMLLRMEKKQVVETSENIIQKSAPVYMRPVSNYGRTHFYAPYKQIGNIAIDTFWFNIIVLWIAIIIFYIALYFNVLQKTITFLGNMHVMPQEK